MTDIATLAIKIETSGEQKAENSLDAIEKKGIKASVAIEQLNKKQSELAQTAQHANQSIIQQSKAVENLSRQSSMIGAIFKGIISGYTALQAIDLADVYTQMGSRIKIAVGAGEEFELVQKRLSENAKQTYRSLEEATEGFLTFNGSMRSLGYSTKQVLDFTDSLTYAFTANATKGYKAQAAMSAIDRAMVRGVIDGKAWQTLMSAVPNTAEIIAKHFKLAEKDVRELGVSGKIASKALIDAFSAVRSDNLAAVEKMPVSFRDGMRTLANSTMEFLGKINQTYDVTGKLAAGLRLIGDNIPAVVSALGALGAYRFGTLLSQVSLLGGAFKGLESTISLVSKGLLLNPFGLALTAIVGLISATGQWGNVIDSIAPIIGGIGSALNDVVTGTLGTIQQIGINLKDSFQEMKKELEATDSVYQGLFRTDKDGFFGFTEEIGHIADLAAYGIKAVGISIHESIRSVGQVTINIFDNIVLAIKKVFGNIINILNKAFEKLNNARNSMAKGINTILPEKFEIKQTQKIEIDNPFDDDLKADFKGLFDNAFKYNERFTELQDRQFGQGLNQAITEYNQSIIDGRNAREAENKALFDNANQLQDISGNLDTITAGLNNVGKKLKTDTEKYFDSMKSETQKYIDKLPEINALKDKGDFQKAWDIEATIDMSKIDWRLFEKMSKPEQLQVNYEELENLINQELNGTQTNIEAMQSQVTALDANTNAITALSEKLNITSNPDVNSNQAMNTLDAGGNMQNAADMGTLTIVISKDNERLAGQITGTNTFLQRFKSLLQENMTQLAVANSY